jgi:putative ABC transport system substrate-binding protein
MAHLGNNSLAPVNHRRAFLALAALSPLGAWAAARSEDAERLPRVALLMFGSPINFRTRIAAFVKGMEDLGYVEGINVLFEFYSANGQLEVLQELARNLNRSAPEVIVSASTLTTAALRQAGVSQPVVMAAVDDPVAEGFARSLARPGGYYTGLSASVMSEAPRFVELLSTAMPKLARVGLLANPSNPTYRAFVSRFDAAIGRIGAKRVVLDASSTAELEQAFPATGQDVVDGLIVMYDTLFYNERMRIVELARDTRRPAVYPQRGYVEAGGLMSFGPQLEASYLRVASYVNKLLKGARPSDLAIELPPKFELVVNRTAARGLNIQFPAAFLQKADKVIG